MADEGVPVLKFSYAVADRALKSSSEQEISAGETYFRGDAGGVLTLGEGERVILGLRDVPSDERKQLAKDGKALADGSFPMANCGDVSNAISALGRAPESKRASVKALIRKRVKELGCKGSQFDSYR